MKLNNYIEFNKVDQNNYVDFIKKLPQEIERGLTVQVENLSIKKEVVQRILIVGVGSERTVAEMIQSYVAPECDVPVLIQKDYVLPKYALCETTLLIIVAHQDDNEVIQKVLKDSKDCDCQRVLILVEGMAEDVNFIPYDYDGPTRASIGFLFGLMLNLLDSLGFISVERQVLSEEIRQLNDYQKSFFPEVPAAQNGAKRYAGQLVERYSVIFGVGFLEPVARRWKNQINLNAKAPAAVEVLPDSSLNTYQGVVNTEKVFAMNMCLFLRSASNFERSLIHEELCRMGMLTEGVNVDFVNAFGDSRFLQLWSLVLLGDYISYYLALIYEVDPTPIPLIEEYWEDLSME